MHNVCPYVLKNTNIYEQGNNLSNRTFNLLWFG